MVGRTYDLRQSTIDARKKALSPHPVRKVNPMKYAGKQSARLRYLGSTPSKKSPTGKTVIERMRLEGKIKNVSGQTLFKEVDGKWYNINDADMGHITDAVYWWNTYGRYFGPRSPEARAFMLNPDNYRLQHYSYNRSDGAKLKQMYMPPYFGGNNGT